MTKDTSSESFWLSPKPHSKAKIEIVSKYFPAWVRILAPRHPNLLYLDLYAGKGKYDNGYPSTPMRILGFAANNDSCRQKLRSVLNDIDRATADALHKNIDSIASLQSLRFKPLVTSGNVDDILQTIFGHEQLPPTFLFADPFGRGLPLETLKRIIRNDGADGFLFFNYNFTNRFIDGESGEALFSNIFGEIHLSNVRSQLSLCRKPRERERTITDGFAKALWTEMNAYSVPFRIVTDEDKIVYLIGISKNRTAYKIMKDIMASFSTITAQGVPMMEFNESHVDKKTLLESLLKPLDALVDELPRVFPGEELTPEDMLMRHGIGKRYILSNYQKACAMLLAQRRISSSRKPGRQNTFAPDIKAIFPK